MTFRGRVKNGAVVLDNGIALPDGAEVTVELLETRKSKQVEEEVPTLYERLKPLIGMAKGLPPDASLNIDHYLYGHPKR